MAWRIVVCPSGRYARFSDVVDNFTHYNMNREEILKVCREELEVYDAEQKVLRAERNPKRFEEEMRTIGLLHGEAEKRRVLTLMRENGVRSVPGEKLTN